MQDSAMDEAIGRWIEGNMGAVGALSPATIHIDELVGAGMARLETVRISVRAFSILAERLRQIGTPLQPLLVIPLVSRSKRLGMAVPASLAALQRQLSDEPPSLHMQEWTPRKYFVVCEECRIPLPFPLTATAEADIYVYYREHRYTRAIQNNWEFDRGVYAELYPDGAYVG